MRRGASILAVAAAVVLAGHVVPGPADPKTSGAFRVAAGIVALAFGLRAWGAERTLGRDDDHRRDILWGIAFGLAVSTFGA